MMASSKPAPKSNPHSRFIPREEISEVSAWRFSAVDGSEDVPERVVPIEDQREADQREAEHTAALEQAVQAAREQAFAEGFAHGHAVAEKEVREALEDSARKSAEENAQRMAQLLQNTRDHLKQNEERISRQMLDLACDLARQVVRQELRHNPQHLLPVITEALAQLVDDGLPATVRMHPNDLALMKVPLQELLGDKGPELVADGNISPGGCLVESASTSVDATMEKRWMRAIANLGLETAWNPENADV
ncbi:MAG: FliH/SctL family protein [Hydrogenophaga sp.]|nr:FliH/SctL family protein [Hydrogenophaga sp.]